MGRSVQEINSKLGSLLLRLPLAWHWRKGKFYVENSVTKSPKGVERNVIFFEDEENETGHLIIKYRGKTYKFNSDETY